jgi:hypothetical protein
MPETKWSATTLGKRKPMNKPTSPFCRPPALSADIAVEACRQPYCLQQWREALTPHFGEVRTPFRHRHTAYSPALTPHFGEVRTGPFGKFRVVRPALTPHFGEVRTNEQCRAS